MGENSKSSIICPKCRKENNIINEYCVECGSRLKEKNSKSFQIVENLKADLYGSVICIVVFVAFMIFVTYGIISNYGAYGFISILIIWPLTIGFIIWTRHYLKGLSKIRRFTITKDYIEIFVPHKPQFHINWTDFNSIEIKRSDSITTVPTGDGIVMGPRFVYFNLIFRGSNLERSYEFESGKDFKVKSRKKILIALEQLAQKQGKTFKAWR